MIKTFFIFFVFSWTDCYSQITRFTDTDTDTDTEMYGFLSEEGDTLFAALFEEATDFKDYENFGPNFNYSVVTKNGKSGILNDQGTFTIPIKYDGISLYQFRDSTSKYRQYARLGNFGFLKHNVRLFDLDKNKMCDKSYEFFSAYCSHFIFKRNNKYGVMDGDMNVIYHESPYHLQTGYKHDYGPCNSLTLQPLDSVLYQRRGVKENRRIKYSFGLVNLFTKKTIPIDYDYIHIKDKCEEKYYWAFKFDSPNGKSGLLHIYNVKMDKIRTISFEEIIFTETNAISQIPRYPFRRDHNPFLFLDTNNKVGGLAPDGSITIPFEFNYESKKATSEYELEYVALNKEGILFYFNEHGEPIEVSTKD